MLAALSATGRIRPSSSRTRRAITRNSHFRPSGSTCTVDGHGRFGFAGGQEAVRSRRLVCCRCLATRRRPPSGRRRRRRCQARTSRLDGVCLNPRRLGFVEALRRMGADVANRGRRIVAGGEPVGSISVRARRPRLVRRSPPTEVPDLIDELPVLAARAALGRLARGQRRVGAAGQGKRPHHGAGRRLAGARRRRRRTTGRLRRPRRPASSAARRMPRAITGWSWRSRSSGSDRTTAVDHHRRRGGRRCLTRASPPTSRGCAAMTSATRSISSASWPAARARSRGRSRRACGGASRTSTN